MSFLALIACVMAPPAPPKLAIEYYKLDNGLKVVLHRDSTVPQVAVTVAYHVGSKNERSGRTGFAHFFEHMMFRGTPNVPNYDIPLQEAGVVTNAFTTSDMTVYFQSVPKEYLERALYMEAERMGFLPKGLDQKKFDVEREVVKNERLQSYENVPYGLSEEAIAANLFPKGHPYSWSVIGSMRDLNAATLDDLRKFFAEYYHPSNATLCLAGDIDGEHTQKLIEKYFAPLAAGPTPRRPTNQTTPAVTKRVVLKDRVRFKRVYWNWPAVNETHQDAEALKLLASILADGEASRLNRSMVRDERVALSVSADADLREIDGLFQIQATLPADRSIGDLEQSLETHLNKIRKTPPTEGELNRVRVQYEQGMYASATSLLGRAFSLSINAAKWDDPRYYEKEFTKTFAVTPADVQRVAAKYLTSARLTLEVEPMKPGEEQTKAFLAGPLESKDEEPRFTDRTPKPSELWKTMPAPTVANPFVPPTIHRQKLSNGVEVWAVPWRTLPLVQMSLLMPSGSADDPQAKLGVAELTAVMLTQGTKRLTAVELAEAFANLGVTPASAVGTESTSLSFGALRRNLRPALELVAEMLATPRHEPVDFSRELDLQKAGVEAGYDSPTWISGRAFRALMHGADHPFGQPNDGTLETIKNIKLDDVVGFHRTHYTSEGSKLIITGDFDPKEIFAELESTLGKWNVPRTVATIRPPSRPAKPGIYLVPKAKAAQAVIRIGRPWVGRNDPDYEAVEIANRLTGEDFLSRLNMNLREKNGFSYGCRSSMGYRKDRGVWTISTSVRADATGAALKELMNELEGLAGKRPISAAEMETNRQALVRAFPENFATPASLATQLADLAEFALPTTEWARYAKAIEATTLEQVRAVGARFGDPKERIVLIVADQTQAENLLREQGFRQFTIITPEGTPKKPSAQ
jgi:zinc protease